MREELENVAKLIDALIAADDYPKNIEPAVLRRAVLDYPSRGGKRLRPALLLWTCGMFGGNPEQAKFAAAAVEIYHNWTLVHDDIIDRDDERRGRPSTHAALAKDGAAEHGLKSGEAARFGRDLAILAGDAQHGWSVHSLARSVETGVDPALVLALVSRLQDLVTRQLIGGEAIDVVMSYSRLDTIVRREVLAMLAMKTGALLRFCAEAGAAIALETADFNAASLAAAGDFAEAAGVAFQLRDDWLGIFGDHRQLGKPLGTDLAEGKPTALLIEALSRLDEDGRRQLLALLRLPRYGESELASARSLIDGCGAAAASLELAETHAAKALAILGGFPENRYRLLLGQWLELLTNRNK